MNQRWPLRRAPVASCIITDAAAARRVSRALALGLKGDAPAWTRAGIANCSR